MRSWEDYKMVEKFKSIESELKTTYYNSEDDTINDFLVPVLKRCKKYNRETYSFSSAIFSLINHALSDLIENECEINYIVGFEIEEKDMQAIEKGLRDDFGIIEDNIKSEFGDIENFINNLDKPGRDIYKHRLTMLSYLISKKLLKIKVGFVSKKGRIKNPSKFKFHPKVMIFEDFSGDKLVANGSTNESFGAHAHNEESFDLFKSWNKETFEYYKRHIDKFEDFWNNKCENIKTIEVNKIIENDLLKNYKNKVGNKKDLIRIEKELNKIFEKDSIKEEKFSLWNHQSEVINNWFKEGLKGIIKFATGAGKTITALSAMDKLSNENKRLITIITTPYKALSEQWYEEAVNQFHDYEVLLAYENQDKWYSRANLIVNSYNMEINNKVLIITVNKTFGEKSFQNVIKKIEGDGLIIVDEVHHFGSELLSRSLPLQFKYRLGLSATPERYLDQKGTKRILTYFGKILSPNFTLNEALQKGILSNYKYHPIIVELIKDEKGGYWNVSEKIQRIWEKYSDNDTRLEKSESLINKRNEILNTASQKIIKLRNLLLKLNPQSIDNTLIYCHNFSHLKKVASLLFELKLSNARITSRESNFEERKHSFDLFKNKRRQVLLAINCLDEGIDIPATNTAFILASSANPKQFIQRRGRLLRKMRDKDNKVIEKDVNIYDFISFPPLNSKGSLPSYEREIILKEIKRIKEFSELALNKDEALKTIENYLKKIKLDF